MLNRQDLYRGLRGRFDEYYLEQVAEWRRRAGQRPLTGLSSFTGLSVVDVSPQTSVAPGLVVESSVSPLSINVSPAAVVGAGGSAESAESPQASFLFAALSYSPTSSRDVTRMLRQRREARRASQEAASGGKMRLLSRSARMGCLRLEAVEFRLRD